MLSYREEEDREVVDELECCTSEAAVTETLLRRMTVKKISSAPAGIVKRGRTSVIFSDGHEHDREMKIRIRHFASFKSGKRIQISLLEMGNDVRQTIQSFRANDTCLEIFAFTKFHKQTPC